MKKLFLLAGVVCATVSGSLTNVNAAPFAMPPYYNITDDNKYQFYGDMNPSPEVAGLVSVGRANATDTVCQPRRIYDHVVQIANDGWHYYDGLFSIYMQVRYSNWPSPTCTDYSAPTLYGMPAVRRWVVCDARLKLDGTPVSNGYAKENFPNSQCPDDTPRPEKCPWCPIIGNPVNVPFGFKVQKEVDIASQYAGGVEFRRYYASLRYPNEFIVPVRGLGKQWRHNYERGIRTVYDYGNAAYVLRGDTSVGYFSSTVGGYVSEADSADKLTQLTDGLGALTGWQYYDARTEDTESYNAQGKLTTITSRKGVVQALSYDANGLLLQVADSFGRTLSFTYDASNRIATMTDPANGQYVYTYAANGALASVTDPGTRTRAYLYEDTGYPLALTGITDENNWRFSRYAYTAQGLVAETKSYAATGVEVNKYTLIYYNAYGSGQTTVTEPSGLSTVYHFQSLLGLNLPSNVVRAGVNGITTFDANANATARYDYNGNQTCRAFDGSRNLEVIRIEGLPTSAVCSTALNGTLTAPARRITTAWHPNYRLPTGISETTSAGNRVTTFTYDTSGNLKGKSVIVAGVARSSSWTYDTFGRVLTATDPRNNTTTNTYFPNDPAQGTNRAMLASVTNAVGHTTAITSYNAHGQPLSLTDTNGLVTSMTYDARQRMTSRAVAGEMTTYEYDGVGQLTKVTMPDASYLNYVYDGAHRLVKIQDGLGNRVVYTLDNSGNRIKEDFIDPANALSRTRQRAFDTLNRLQQDIGGATPATQVTQYAYDANGNQSSSTDPLNRVTTQTYDALNRLLQVIDPVNGGAAPTKYEYDTQDNLSKVTDPKNLATIYAYNGFNELTSRVSPDTGTSSFTYDAAGNMVTKTDARNVTSTYSYDALNRATAIGYPAYGGDPAETVTYTYDSCANGKGRLCTLTDKTGTTTYSYNTFGRTTAKSQAVAGLTQNLGYGYNSAGQLTSVTYPSGAAIGYGYANNRIASVTVNGVTVLSNADYEPFGPVGEWSWGNSTLQTPNKHVRFFDLDGRNTKIESIAGLEPTVIVYDAVSRITNLQKLTANAVDPTKSATFGYDNLDRLTTVTPNAGNPNVPQGFTYDGVGNRLTATVASSVTNYGYGTTSHRLNSLTGTTSNTYTYDAAGNRATGTGATWTYGANNRPVQVSTGATTTTYLINALGQRVRKATSGIGTRFVYDEGGRLIGEYNDSGTRISETVWFNDLPVAVMK